MNPDLIKGLFGDDDKLGLYGSKLSGLFGDTSLDESFNELFNLLETTEHKSTEDAVSRSTNDDNEQISAIRNLKDIKTDIIILIEKFLNEYTPKETLIALQEKLILMFDYESNSNLNIPKPFTIENLQNSIIEFFNFIDFENDEDIINNFRCNVLKKFIKEVNSYLLEI